MTKAKAITNNIVENTKMQRTLLYGFLGVLGILLVVYVYLIGSITFNILARKSLESDLQVLSSKVSKLELSYLDSMNKVDKNYAFSIGFVDNKDNIFATRGATSVAVR